MFKILFNDAVLKGTVEINEFRFAFPLDVFQLVANFNCKLDTSPSCKELGVFNKYNCFSFDVHVCRLILESEGKKYEKTDPRTSRPVCNFLTPKQTPIGMWDLVSRFPSRYRHFEFLIHLLIG